MLPPIDTSAHAMAEKEGHAKIKSNKVLPQGNGAMKKAALAADGSDAARREVDSTITVISDALGNAKQPQCTNGGPSVPIGKWSFHSRLISEDSTGLFPDASKAPTLTAYEKRKKHFADAKARKEVVIWPDNIYAMDYYDAYFDFNTMSLKLPGFSVNAFRYWDGQPLRFVCRSRDRSTVFFVVQFELLDRAKLGIPPAEIEVSVPGNVADVLEDPVESP